MNKLVTLLLCLALFTAQAQRNVPVSTLPAADSLGQNDFFPIVQGGHYHKAYIWQLPHNTTNTTAPPVAQPTWQLVFGTGAGISSDSGLTYSHARGLLGRYNGFGAVLGLGNLTNLNGADSSAVLYGGKQVTIAAGATNINANNLLSLGGNYVTIYGGNYISINGGHFFNNTITQNAYIDNNILYNGATMANNVVSGHSQIVNGFLFADGATVNANILSADTSATGFAPGIEGYELFNDCHIDSNVISTPGSIGDIRAQALCSVTGNQLTGSKQMMDIAGITQTLFDHVDHNVLQGNSTAIQTINQYGNSNVTYDTIMGDNSSIQKIFQRNSSISNCRLDSANYSFQNIDLKESGIYNADNINITGLNLQGVDLYLNGFNRNISNENIVNGNGYFAQTLNFGSAPADSGQPLYINIVPPGYSITKIILSTNNSLTPGATLTMGLEADNPALVSIATDSLNAFNVIWTGASISATANRSFYLIANAAINTGTLNIYVEFTQLNANKDVLVYRH